MTGHSTRSSWDADGIRGGAPCHWPLVPSPPRARDRFRVCIQILRRGLRATAGVVPNGAEQRNAVHGEPDRWRPAAASTAPWPVGTRRFDLRWNAGAMALHLRRVLPRLADRLAPSHPAHHAVRPVAAERHPDRRAPAHAAPAWPLCLLAALPAHLFAQVCAPWPMSMVLALFLTNCSEALVGAAVVRASATRRRASTPCGGWWRSCWAPSSRARSSPRSSTRPSSPASAARRTGGSGRRASPPTCSASWRWCPPSSPWWAPDELIRAATPRRRGRRLSASRWWWPPVFTASRRRGRGRGAVPWRPSSSCCRCWSGPPSASAPAAPACPS